MALSELQVEPDYLTFTPLELIQNNIETERLETISLDNIDIEAAIVDEGHAQDLGNSMAQKRGQITPIAVRARFDEESRGIRYDVIDGFHRSTGKKMNGETEINATVIYGCSDEEMYDLRILAASSVRSVQYPRIARWINDSWANTDWAMQGMSAAQAFAITINDTKRVGYQYQMSPTEVEGIKDWVSNKCNTWKRSVGSTYGILRVVTDADPDLVQQVRISGGGKDRTGRITPARLQAVVDAFPGEDNYPAQRAILQVVVENRFYAEETKDLVKQARRLILPGMSEQEIYDVVESIKLEHPAKKSPPKSDGLENESLIDDLVVESEDLRTPRISHKTKNGDTANDKDSNEIMHSLEIENHNLKGEIEKLKGEIQTLQEGRLEDLLWWRTQKNISPVERECMERIIYRSEDIRRVARDLGITDVKAATMIMSSFYKKNVTNDALREQYSEVN